MAKEVVQEQEKEDVYPAVNKGKYGDVSIDTDNMSLISINSGHPNGIKLYYVLDSKDPELHGGPFDIMYGGPLIEGKKLCRKCGHYSDATSSHCENKSCQQNRVYRPDMYNILKDLIVQDNGFRVCVDGRIIK